MRKTNKLVIIITIVLCVLCISGFVTYGIIHSKLLEIKDEVNNLKVNVKVATADEAEPTIVLETVNPKSNLENELSRLNEEISQYTKHKAEIIDIAENFIEARYTYEGKQYEEKENILNAISPYVCQDYYDRLAPALDTNGQGNMVTTEYPSGYNTEVIRTFEQYADEDTYTYSKMATLFVEARQTIKTYDSDSTILYEVTMIPIEGNWYVYDCIEKDSIYEYTE